MNQWVCKSDGRIQCQSDPEITLDVMRLDLASIIGDANILSEKKITVPTIKMCGVPAGTLNAYEITDEGYRILVHGFVGRQGFRDCPGDGQPAMAGVSDQNTDESNFALGVAVTQISSAMQSPVLVRELIGHRVRVYEEGSIITMDYIPDRVNVVTKKNYIADIWFG